MEIWEKELGRRVIAKEEGEGGCYHSTRTKPLGSALRASAAEGRSRAQRAIQEMTIIVSSFSVGV